MKPFHILFFLLTAAFCNISIDATAADTAETIPQVIEGANYIFCLDGGGSKTELQVLNRNGVPYPLFLNGNQSFAVFDGGTNPNSAGVAQTTAVLHRLIDQLAIGEEKIDARTILPQAALIGGVAGIGRDDEYRLVRSILVDIGFTPERIALLTDANLSLEMAGDNGVIVIAGTGSICLGKKGSEIKRAGGLGRLIGDEGSGYQIGIRGVRKALEYEYGFGPATALLPMIKEKLGVSELKQVIRPIHSGEITPSQIAALAPIVFEAANANDAAAKAVITQAAQELGDLAANVLNQINTPSTSVLFIGGVFKNPEAASFIELILATPSLQQATARLSPSFANAAFQNPAVNVIKKVIDTK